MKSIAKTKAEIQRDYEKRTGYAAQKKYDSEKVIKIVVRLNREKDADIIDKLDQSKPLSTQIKALIRKDIAEQSKTK